MLLLHVSVAKTYLCPLSISTDVNVACHYNFRTTFKEQPHFYGTLYASCTTILCAPHSASNVARNAVRASVLICDLGLPVVFAPLLNPNFEANPKFLTGITGILLQFGV